VIYSLFLEHDGGTRHVGDNFGYRKVRPSDTTGTQWSLFAFAEPEKKDNPSRQKEFPFIQTLLPGAWNKVQIIIPSTKAEDFKFLRLSIDTDVISLNVRR